MSQKLDARPAVPRVDDAAECLLRRPKTSTKDDACLSGGGARLDLSEAALDLSIQIANVKRLSSIANLVCDQVFKNRMSDGANISVGNGYVHLALTPEQADDLRFIVENVKEAAATADEMFEALENLMSSHHIVADSRGGAA